MLIAAVVLSANIVVGVIMDLPLKESILLSVPMMFGAVMGLAVGWIIQHDD